MMKQLAWAGSGRRRGILLFASCAVPLFFIFLTTSFFYPEYFNNSFLSRNPGQTGSTSKADSSQPQQASSGSDKTPSAQPQSTDQLPKEWVFDTKRDERQYGLNEAQCGAAFPDFYKEIDRAVAFRQEKGLENVREEDVDIEWREEGEIIRVMLYDRQVRTDASNSDLQRLTRVITAIRN
jgi:hypothetical protein